MYTTPGSRYCIIFLRVNKRDAQSYGVVISAGPPAWTSLEIVVHGSGRRNRDSNQLREMIEHGKTGSLDRDDRDLAHYRATTGHLNVVWLGIRRPVACDSRAAMMISQTCRACSAVKSGSRPVAMHSATSDAPCSHT